MVKRWWVRPVLFLVVIIVGLLLITKGHELPTFSYKIF